MHGNAVVFCEPICMPLQIMLCAFYMGGTGCKHNARLSVRVAAHTGHIK